MKFRTPNNPETKMIDICRKFKLPYNFVGNGTLIIRGFNPDFVNTENKKFLIEIFGDYWHNRPDWAERDKRRLKTFLENGYKTLVLWESDIMGSHPKYSEEQIRSIILDESNYT